ncbi:MAG TPA: hypothetical protein VMM60_03265 [Ilumatobacter sp.]|nr:hypothetical protein [Ilumatobacter sp.]
MIRRSLALLVCLVALSACRLDVTVSVDMEPDGTGIVTVVAVADADLVSRVPGIADDLRLEDVVAQGWAIDGPTASGDGSITATLTHPFSSNDELANLLNSIGPPFTSMQAVRTIENEHTTNAIDGTLVLPSGFDSFADADLVAAVGGRPFAEEIAASGATPDSALSFTFRVSLPGELISSETGREVGDGVIEWTAPLDGSSVGLFTSTVQRPAGAGTAWAEPVAKIAFVALIAWVAVSAAFIGFVALARRKKRARRERALAGLKQSAKG